MFQNIIQKGRDTSVKLKTNLILLASVLILAICAFSFLSDSNTDPEGAKPAIEAGQETEQGELADVTAGTEMLAAADADAERAAGTQQSDSQEDEIPSGSNQESGSASETEAGQTGLEAEGTEEKQTDSAAAEKFLANMTLEEKAAQMFILTPEALTGYNSVTSAGEATKAALQNYPVGGLIYFNGSIQSAEQVKEMVAGQQQYSMERIGLPLFISVDEEGGKVARVANDSPISVEHFPYMPEIGAAEDAVARAQEVGDGIGSYLHELGFNLDFAPVADVLTNPENTVVKERSFGSDPEKTAELAAAVASHLERQGVYSCLKHFPGHGATAADSHKGYAYIDKTLEELRAAELIPFQRGIEAGASFVMVGHISVPKVTGDDTPATLSKTMIDILRNELQFDGIVITDAMNMGAITNDYSSGEAAVKAIEAGVDIILMPADFKAAYAGILDAVKTGKISEERIDASVRRIITIKQSGGNEYL